jgi:two-component system response regulator PilR (NtrC family)
MNAPVTPCALIVDDEPDIRELIALTLQRMGVRCDAAADIAEARRLLAERSYAVCLTDMRLPDGNGLDLVAHIQQCHPQVPVAVITAHGNMESAIQALKCGAFDFVSKPVDINVLRNLVGSAVNLSEAPAAPKHALIGVSAALAAVREKIAKLARSQAPVYISGESGTGKELVARLIHESGPRASGPFVPVNCGAIPAELIESELFGHKRGSFTGAVTDKDGLFQAAHGGTLFLDEIAELPLHMQVMLLRAIQEKAVRPVGAQREVPVDCRILSATHKDLAVLAALGRFRQDLYYRINVIDLQVPPLRERPEDIGPLTIHFLNRLAQEYRQPVPEIDTDACATLERYPFPGNVRELENILERALTLCEDHRIRVADLHLPAPSAPAERLEPPTVATSAEVSATPDNGELQPYLDKVERRRIRAALERTRWNRTAAARDLGITLRALRYRMEKLGLE